MRRTLMGVAGGLVMLTLVACGANTPSDSGLQSRVATGVGEAPAAQKPVKQKRTEPKPLVVRGEGALIRPYAAKSLREFAADPYVVGAVRGTVTKVEAQANDVGYVTSIVTVSVERGLGLKAGSTIQVSEPGGVVPMSEVRSDFEGKDWQKPLTVKELSQMVDYQMEGFPHSSVGDDVAMFLADGAGDGVYTLATALVTSGAGFSFKDNNSPNPSWGPDVSSATVDALVKDAAEYVASR
jgi:hypothetical protein